MIDCLRTGLETDSRDKTIYLEPLDFRVSSTPGSGSVRQIRTHDSFQSPGDRMDTARDVEAGGYGHGSLSPSEQKLF
ncbi:hypothetical protein AAF712_005230 [Marasmius tenuissimus]|uniref:Uncharacterized protein n=1 Tax=Marasmius tenuissimus TaxID=585030 RepID=A0ABR3A2S6_9AGAR